MATIKLPLFREQAYKSVLWPAALTLFLAAVLAWVRPHLGAEIGVGGGIWGVVNFGFTYRVFSKIKSDPKQWILRFLAAEGAKLFLGAALLFFCAHHFSLGILGVMIGYAIAQSLFFIFFLFYTR